MIRGWAPSSLQLAVNGKFTDPETDYAWGMEEGPEFSIHTDDE